MKTIKKNKIGIAIICLSLLILFAGFSVSNIGMYGGLYEQSYTNIVSADSFSSDRVYPIIDGEPDIWQAYEFEATSSYLQLNAYVGDRLNITITNEFYCGDGTTYTNSSDFTFRFNKTYCDNTIIKTFNIDASDTIFFSGSFFRLFYHTYDTSNLLDCAFGEFVDTSLVTDMHDMFYNCVELTNLDISGFDTNNVINMARMFNNCESITSLDLSGFNTNNVTNMASMFSYCDNLSSIDLSGFDTGNVTAMDMMFYACNNLTSIDLSSFDTSNVTSMDMMFYHCQNLTILDLSSFNTSNVTSTIWMFEGCNNLTGLDLSGFDTGNITNMNRMFYNCENLRSLDVSGFNTSNVTNISGMFYNCLKLTSLDLSGFYVGNDTVVFNFLPSAKGDLKNLNIPYYFGPSVSLDAGWIKDDSGISVNDLQNFTEQSYLIVRQSYTIKFVNYDGTVLQSSTFLAGQTPEYTGNVPTKPSTLTSLYYFDGWSPEIDTANSDATYTATYLTVFDNTIVIISIVVGVVAVLLIAVVVILIILKKRKMVGSNNSNLNTLISNSENGDDKNKEEKKQKNKNKFNN